MAGESPNTRRLLAHAQSGEQPAVCRDQVFVPPASDDIEGNVATPSAKRSMRLRAQPPATGHSTSGAQSPGSENRLEKFEGVGVVQRPP